MDMFGLSASYQSREFTTTLDMSQWARVHPY